MPGPRTAGRGPGTPDLVCIFRCPFGDDSNQSLKEGPQHSSGESLLWLSYSRGKVIPLLRNTFISSHTIDWELGWKPFGNPFTKTEDWVNKTPKQLKSKGPIKQPHFAWFGSRHDSSWRKSYLNQSQYPRGQATPPAFVKQLCLHQGDSEKIIPLPCLCYAYSGDIQTIIQ